MEINVTKVVNAHIQNDIPARYCSGSVMELGPQAAQMTWDCSKHAGALIPFDEEQQSEVRDHIREYGAWDDDEINEYSPLELQAFIAQEVMQEIRNLEDDLDLENFSDEEFQKATENEGGRLFKSGIDWYFYVGL
jgi:hypothetical protein